MVGGQTVGHTSDQQTAEQMYNNLTGQPNSGPGGSTGGGSGAPSPGSGSGATYSTPNGPMTIAQMRAALQDSRVGYDGPWDDASVIAAYNRTAVQPGTSTTLKAATPSAQLADLLAASNAQDFAEKVREFNATLAENQRQFNDTTYTDLAKALLSAASSLSGPANYFEFNQLTSGGRDLEQQLFGAQPRDAFSAPAGKITPMSVDQLIADLGFNGPLPGTQPMGSAVTADQVAAFARNMNVPAGIAQDYVNQTGALPSNVNDFTTWMTTNGYRNPDGSLTGKQGPTSNPAAPSSGATAHILAAATPTPGTVAGVQAVSPTARTATATTSAATSQGPDFGALYDKLIAEATTVRNAGGGTLTPDQQSTYLQSLGLSKSIADPLTAAADQITHANNQGISRDAFAQLGNTIATKQTNNGLTPTGQAIDYGQLYDKLLAQAQAFRDQNGRWMTPEEQSSYIQSLGVDPEVADRLAMQADQATRGADQRITRDAFAQLGAKLGNDKASGVFFQERLQKTPPFQINPIEWNNLGPVGQQLTLSAAKSAGWDPNEWLYQLQQSFPKGNAPKAVTTDYGAGASPAGVY